VFGPNDSVEVFGTVGFVTDCPEGGTPDGWPYGVYPIGDVYVLRDGTIDGYSGAALTDISGIPNTVVGGPSFVEIVAYTAPGGNLGAGEYDLVLDECQDGYYDPSVDFMLGIADDIAFVVVVPTDIPSLAIQQIKADAQNEALHWAGARGYFRVLWLMYILYGYAYSPAVAPMEFIVSSSSEFLQGSSTLTDLLQIGFGMDLLVYQHVKHWAALAADPPDPGYEELAELDTIEVVCPSTDLYLEQWLARYGNEIREQAAILSALLTSLERYQGARAADNRDYALLQAGQIDGYAHLLAASLADMNLSINDVIQGIQNTGIDFTAYANELTSLQNRINVQGFTQDEIWELKSFGLTDEQIEEAKQNFLNEDFSEFLAGDVTTKLLQILNANQSTVSSLEDLAVNAVAAIDSLSQLVELRAPVSDPGGPYSGAEGVPILFNGSGSYDPNDDPITFVWELNGDAQFDDGSTATPQYTYYSEQTRLVGLRVADTTGLSNTKYTSVTVTSVNEPPVIDSSSPGNSTLLVFAEDTLIFRIWASDPDGDIVNYAWTVNDSLVNTQDSLIFVADTSAIGLSVVSVSISDGNQLSRDIIRRWGVLVRSQNHAPVIVSIPDTAAVVGVEYTYDMDASDVDGDSLIYSLDVFPSGMTIDEVTGIVSWLPAMSQIGPNNVTLIVEDGRGGVATQMFTISVTAINHSPLITSVPETTAYVNALYQYDVNASDPDGDPLVYSLTTFPSEMAIDGSTGLISWVPTDSQVGLNDVVVEVNDNRGGSDSQSFVVIVESGVPGIIIESGCTVEIFASAGLYQPTEMAFGGDGYLYVAQGAAHTGNLRIARVSPEGLVSLFGGYVRDPDGVAIDTTGNVLFVSGDGRISKILPDQTTTTFSYGFNNLNSIVVDSDNNLYVLELDGRVFKVTQGAVITPVAGGFDFCPGGGTSGLSIDSQDNLYVVDPPGGRVFKVELRNADAVTTLVSNLAYPRNFILTPSGAAFVSLQSTGELLRICPDGEISTFASGLTPASLALGNVGELYISEYMKNRIIRITCESFSCAKGSVSGYVFHNSLGFSGAPVNLFDSAGYIVTSTLSDDSGWYQFEDLENGHYSVSLSTPLGYRTDEETKAVEVLGLHYEVNFELTKLDIPTAQRGRGYWMHQVNALLSGHGNAHETYDDMCNYMELIRTHFNEHQLNPVNIFSVDLESDCDQRLDALRVVISPKPKSSMNDKAKAHLTTLLLNMVSGKIAQWEYISEDSATVSQAITYCNALITDTEPENDETAKAIAEMINEGQTVPVGMIDLATANIAYKHSGDESLPTEFSLGQNYPNPFNPITDISFSLPVASHVKLEIFNVMGQKVATVVDRHLEAGNHSVTWDGSQGASGVYLYRLTAGDFVESKKMVLLK